VKSFNVYVKNGKFKAVKNGWSWPAFFFGSIWAIFMQLWLLGLFLLPVELLLQMLVSSIEKTQRSAPGNYSDTTEIIGGVVALAALLIRIIFGAYGNSWKRKKLEKSTYRLVKTLESSSKDNAISLCKNLAP
jgi:Protein of unknown function (DUF2628)